MHRKVREKQIQACSLNLYMNSNLKIKEKIDVLNLESFI